MRGIWCSEVTGTHGWSPCPGSAQAAEAGNYNIPLRHHFLRPPWFILICLIFKPAPAAQPTFTNIPSLSHQKFTCCPNATGDATNENNFENSASIFWTRETWWESWTKCNCVHLYKEAWSKVHTACGKPPIVHTAYKSHSAIGKCVSVCLVQQQACDWLVSIAWPITGLLLDQTHTYAFSDRAVGSTWFIL